MQPCQNQIACILSAGLLTAAWIAPVHAESYPARYLATIWQTEQGLPQNSVNALLQDHEGYLWIGTFGGVARFDGERFTVFDAGGTPGFDSGSVLSLYEGRSGVLWVGTTTGLTKLQNGVSTTYTERDGLPNKFINSVRGDVAGNVWINSSGGVARFDGAKWQPFPTYRGKPVREFYLQARDGSMWFRYGKEVMRFGADGSFATMSVPNPSVFLVHEASDGRVWIGIRDAYRLVQYYQGVFSDVPLPRVERRAFKAWAPECLLTMAEDVSGELLLLTPAGLVRTVGGKLSSPVTLRLPAYGGELPKARSLLADREGNLWVGMIGAGLVCLRPATLTAYAKAEGLSDSSFNAVFQDREGRIWLGGDLLYWFDGQRFHFFRGVANTVAITQTRDGDLWFGGFGGLYRWRAGVLTHFNTPDIASLYEDREGTLWIGGLREERPTGLFRFREGKLDRIPGISSVTKITEARAGGLLVAAPEGLISVRGGQASLAEQNRTTPARIREIYDDAAGNRWVTTSGGGFMRVRDGRMKAITAEDGLPNNTVLRFIDDGNGNLWAGSNQGIFRLNLKELNDFADGKISSVLPISYGVAEGMRTSECNGGTPGAFKTTDGRIWFPTVRGVVAIDPAAGNRLPPRVVVEEASAGKVRLARDGRTSAAPGNNTFDFRFTGLSFSAPAKVRFKYRLEPYDKDWVNAGTRRTAHYTNMPPGKYSFHVIAASSYAIWNEQGARLQFQLQPHFYQTSWFYVLCAIGFLTLLWRAHEFRLHQVQRAFSTRLEGRVEERTRIARELHDTLLQSFQGLMFSFQAARNLLPGRIDEAIRTLEGAIAKGDDAVAEGRDAIQNLRLGSPQTRLEDLLTATGQELREAHHGSTPSPVFLVSLEGQPRSLSPLLQDEIYRIAREVLRNAFQHAGANRIEAAIQYDAGLFRLRMRDNGKGIDPAVLKQGARAGHWGLPGIRERAKRIGARFALWSENGAGTEVELTLPARVAYLSGDSRQGLRLFRKRKAGS